MKAAVRRNSLRSGLLLVLSFAVSAPIASAGEVPPSALASARRMDSALVDSNAQMLLHPQIAAGLPSQLTAFYAESSYRTVGVLFGDGDRFSLGLASQRDPALANSPLSSVGYAGLQGLLAARFGPVRVGTSYRRGRVSDRYFDESVYIHPSSVDQRARTRDYERETDEIALGIGWSSGRAYVDATAMRSRWQRSAHWIEESDYVVETDTSTRLDTSWRWGGALRAGVPVRGDLLVEIFCAFADRRARFDASHLVATEPDFRTDEPTYGHEWKALASIGRLYASTWLVRLHGGYADRRDPGMPGGSSYVNATLAREERETVGVSLERSGWWGLELYAGATTTRTRERREQLDFGPISVQQSVARDVSVESSFGWGASRTIGDFDLAAYVSSRLSVADPIVSLDAALRF
ncbi:MAG: hypothetical protein R3B81_14560 [bacterium]